MKKIICTAMVAMLLGGCVSPGRQKEIEQQKEQDHQKEIGDLARERNNEVQFKLRDGRTVTCIAWGVQITTCDWVGAKK